MTVCLFTATSTFLDRDIGVLGSSAPLLSTFQAPLSLLSDAHWRCSLSTCTPRSYSSSSMQSVDMYSSILFLIVDAVCRHVLLDLIPHRRCSLLTCTPRSYPSSSMQSADMNSSILFLIVDAVCQLVLLDPIPQHVMQCA